MDGGNNIKRLKLHTDAFFEFKKAESQRVQTYYYGLFAVAAYAIFSVKITHNTGLALPGLILLSMIFTVMGYYCWHMFEMANSQLMQTEALLAEQYDVADQEGGWTLERQNNAAPVVLRQKKLNGFCLWLHLASLAGAILSTLLIIIAFSVYIFEGAHVFVSSLAMAKQMMGSAFTYLIPTLVILLPIVVIAIHARFLRISQMFA